MAETKWDEKLRVFLERAGADFRRMGNDIKEEAQKLLTEVKDPDTQRKIREGLREVGDWAKKTAEDVAVLVEKGAEKAEAALHRMKTEQKSASPATEAPPQAAKPRKAAKRTKKATKKAVKKTLGRSRPKREI